MALEFARDVFAAYPMPNFRRVRVIIVPKTWPDKPTFIAKIQVHFVSFLTCPFRPSFKYPCAINCVVEIKEAFAPIINCQLLIVIIKHLLLFYNRLVTGNNRY